MATDRRKCSKTLSEAKIHNGMLCVRRMNRGEELRGEGGG
jgi:hypothetical protein